MDLCLGVHIEKNMSSASTATICNQTWERSLAQIIVQLLRYRHGISFLIFSFSEHSRVSLS